MTLVITYKASDPRGFSKSTHWNVSKIIDTDDTQISLCYSDKESIDPIKKEYIKSLKLTV